VDILWGSGAFQVQWTGHKMLCLDVERALDGAAVSSMVEASGVVITSA
jgi:hypothetical protein